MTADQILGAFFLALPFAIIALSAVFVWRR
jgi:hypothetical protein